MSTLTFNGTQVDYGSSSVDLIVDSSTATNGIYTISSVAGAAYYRNVTVRYGFTLKIPRTADFRVNTKLLNSGTITFADAAVGANSGTTGAGGSYGGSGGGGGGGYTNGSAGQNWPNTQWSSPAYGGTANENFLTGTITNYTTVIPGATGTGSAGAGGASGSGPSFHGPSGPFAGGGGGAGGGAIKIIAKVFENNGYVDVRGGDGGNGSNSTNDRGTGGGGGGGGGGGSCWFIGDQLIGYGNFYATGGAGGGGGGVSGNWDGSSGLPGGAGGTGAIRLDIGTKSEFVGFFYAGSNAYIITNNIPYVPDSAGSGTTSTYVYTFGTDSTASNNLRAKMFQSSEIKVINSNQTFAKSSSPYYFNKLIVATNYTLTLEDGVVIYCKNLQIDQGGILKNIEVYSGSGNGGSATGTPKDMNTGSGGGGGGFAATGGNGTQAEGGAGSGGSAYNGFTSLTNPMMENFSSVSVFNSYRGSPGGSGSGTEHRYTVVPGGGQENYEVTDHSSGGGGGGYGKGFAKIFAWESIIDGTWDAKGGNGGNGGPIDYEESGGGGGGGSGGGLHLTTGKLSSTSGATGIIDIRGGSGGVGQRGNNGGAGSHGRAYIWCNNTTFTAATNAYSSSYLTINTSSITSSVDSSQPSGSLYVYQKALPGGSFTTVNQYSLQNYRLFDSVKIRHSVNERPYNYAARLYKNDVLQSNPTVETTVTNIDLWFSSGEMTWSSYQFTQPGTYKFTFYSSDYWGNSGENSTGVLTGTVIPPGIPLSF